ncbi:MAG TPA: histidine kinase [Humibacter sp.]|nr:histidine kinase [Humibacter sp.]
MLYESRSGWAGVVLNLIGVVVVAYFLIQQYATSHVATWVFVVGLVSLAGWLVVSDWGDRIPSAWTVVAAAFAMIAAGSLGAGPSNGLLIVPAAIGVLRLLGDLRVTVWAGCSAALVAAVLVAIGSLTVDTTPLGFVALEGGVALGLLGGVNRRQARRARQRERELIESTVAAKEEHARATSLEARQRVARDVHDVLAHSLGGMVVQLDAVEALLEAGRRDEALGRIRGARELAASGLGEARRAVDALRSPVDDEHDQVAGEVVVASLAELIAAHRGIAGSVDFALVGEPRAVPPDVAIALRRALQEALANARKHAPGQPVTARSTWTATRVELQVTNPLVSAVATELAQSGGGNGLPGMRERFVALPGGEMRAGIRDNVFVVEAGADA